jgi:hypothetical protein
MGILISFLQLLLYLAIIIFIAYAILWLFRDFMKWPIDANLYKWGQIIVGLICIIAIVMWLAGLLGFGGGLPTFWQYRAVAASPVAAPAPGSSRHAAADL